MIEFSKLLPAGFNEIPSIRVGRTPRGEGTPDRYVTLAQNDQPLLRVDVYPYPDECFAFQEALVWRDMLVIGFGNHVHAISLADYSVVTVALQHYFGHFNPTTDYLLIASGDRLLRMQSDRRILWKSETLAVDGIIVRDPGPPVICGEAERDPPGGWQAFTVSASDGRILPNGNRS